MSFKETMNWMEISSNGETTPVAADLRKEVFDILIRCVKEEKNTPLRTDALLALAKAKYHNAIPLIKEILKNDDDFDIKNAASLALGILEDKSSINDFKEILANTKASSYEIIKQSHNALALGYISNTNSVEILKEVVSRNGKSSNELQCSALLALGNNRDKTMIPFIGKILNNPLKDESIRAYAAIALGKIRDLEALPELKKAMNDKKNNVRSSVAIAFGLINSSDVKDDLIQMLDKDKSPEVRGFAAISLAQLKDKSVYPALSKLMKKNDYYTENMAIIALGILGDEQAIPEIKELIEKKRKPLSYSSAILTLGLLKDKSSVPMLMKIVEKDTADMVSWSYAIQALGMIGDQQAIPLLEKTLKKSTERIDLALNAYTNLTVALAMLGKRKETLAYLYEQLKNEDLYPELKYRVLHSLAYIGDKSSLEPLLKFYKSQKDDYIKTYAIFALGYILDKNKINPLYKITADNNFDIWLNITDHIFMNKPD